MNNKDVIHVVLASDNNYFPYIYVAIKTLIQSNENNVIDLYYIEDNVTDENLSYLKELQKNNIKITVIPFKLPSPYDKILPKFMDDSLPNVIETTNTTYAKFWFCEMFPNLNKILYLDPDVLVLDDLYELYSTCIDDYLIAGVVENLPAYHRIASKMNWKDSYVNGGMLLMNLKKWRDEKINEKIMKRLLDTKKILNYDQGIINEVCNGSIYVLPPKFNVLAELFAIRSVEKIKKRYDFYKYYTQHQVDEAVYNPVIVHFTKFLYGKPMNLPCKHPYAGVFRWMIRLSPIKVDFSNTSLPRKVRIRRAFFKYLPFSIYNFLEKVLDIRRKYKI
ncbi:glycosyltransferase family 8 protein [Selenomonas ruminis]|uniref:Glycosyltransferase family 8 protein n=1 Tax=Selenomonas ruminis TaxID=2593411 RepID=A0A5D6WAA7_9FIRM|nr:glycosyltransferase family 8 protein [Selenomonas sp. mPRGC5]TYZ24846.1 glycosyltransferase family 8 protein [Selenomonas sp. mPRGC5]